MREVINAIFYEEAFSKSLTEAGKVWVFLNNCWNEKFTPRFIIKRNQIGNERIVTLLGQTMVTFNKHNVIFVR